MQVQHWQGGAMGHTGLPCPPSQSACGFASENLPPSASRPLFTATSPAHLSAAASTAARYTVVPRNNGSSDTACSEGARAHTGAQRSDSNGPRTNIKSLLLVLLPLSMTWRSLQKLSKGVFELNNATAMIAVQSTYIMSYSSV